MAERNRPTTVVGYFNTFHLATIRSRGKKTGICKI